MRTSEGAALPGEIEQTAEGPLHRIRTYLPPAHCHGRVAIARARAAPAEAIAGLALDEVLAGVDPSRVLFLDTETTGLSGGTGTLAFLVGLGWWEGESLCVEQLLLPRPGHERSVLTRLAERLAEASCIATFNGKSFDWPLIRSRAVMNRVTLPPISAHLDLLHCSRRVFGQRLKQVRLVQLEAEVLGMRRERDVDGAEIPHLYWEFVRGAEASRICPVIEHNANDVIALAALLAILVERWERALGEHEPEDRLGVARVALRAGDVDRAARFARAAIEGGASAEVSVQAWWVAARAALRREDHGAAEDALLHVLEHARAAGDEIERARGHLALAKHFEHRRRLFGEALAHARGSELIEGHDAQARRIARLERKLERDRERLQRPAGARVQRRASAVIPSSSSTCSSR